MKSKHYFLWFILSLTYSITHASPATQATVDELINIAHLSKTIEAYKDERLPSRAAHAYLTNTNTHSPEYKEQHTQIKNLISVYLAKPEFATFYQQQLSEPFKELFFEEELVHLISIYEHPLAQQYLNQSIELLFEHLEKDYREYDPEKWKKTNQQIDALLDTL